MLNGVRVVEVCPLFPGPFAAQILRRYGATVTKIVPSASGGGKGQTAAGTDDPMASFSAGGGASPMSVFDDGKTILALDLSLEDHAKKLRDVVAEADALLLGFRPGSLDRFGLHPFELRRLHPRLVVCNLSGFGLSGPLSRRAGHDINYLARAGVLAMRPGLGTPTATAAGDGGSDLPVRAPLPTQVADIAGGTYPVVMHVLAALYRRTLPVESLPNLDGLPGPGCVLDISMTDCSHSLLILSEAVAATVVPVDLDGGRFFLCGAAPCYNLYPTRDGRYMAVGALEAPYWRRVVAALELPASFLRPSVQFGLQDREATVGAIRGAFLKRTLAEWTQVFDGLDAMVDPVLTPAEARDSDLLRFRHNWHRSVMESVGPATTEVNRPLVHSVPPIPAMYVARPGGVAGATSWGASHL